MTNKNKLMRSNFIVIQGWMITDLELKGNKLILFAIIYAFSQDGVHEFAGSLNYIREWLGGVSKSTVVNTLNELISIGFIIKRQQEEDGVINNYYKVNLDVINDYAVTETGQGSTKIDQSENCTSPKTEQGVVQKSNETCPKIGQSLSKNQTDPCPKIGHNKYIYNNNININNKDSISMCSTSDDALPHTEPTQPQRKKNVKESKHRYGEYQHVLLTDTEIEKLKTEYGAQLANEAVTFLDEYIEMKGYSAKSHYLCIRKWVINAVHEKQERDRKAFSGRQLTRSEQEMQEFYNMTERWAESDEEGF